MTYSSQTQHFNVRHPVLHSSQVLRMVRIKFQPSPVRVAACRITEHGWVLGPRGFPGGLRQGMLTLILLTCRVW